MNDISMLKKYQTFKGRKYIKTNTCLLFFQSNKPKAINWRKNEQLLKKLQLTYYKLNNKIILKSLKNSIYKNLTPLISGVVFLLKSKINKIENYTAIEKALNNTFSLLCLKLNNKIYSLNEIKKFYNFSHKKNIFFLYQSIEKYLKVSFIFTNNKSK